MQTAYLKVLDGRASFAGRADFRTFLFGVIRRTASEERRRSLVRAVLPLAAVAEPAASQDGADDRIERDEASRELLAALTALSARQRDVLHLVFYQDLTIEQAADVLGVSVGSARTHYARGKDRLRRRLGGFRE